MTRVAVMPIKVDLATASAPDRAAVDAARQTLALDQAVKARDRGRAEQARRFKEKHGVDLPACFHTRTTTGKADWEAWCQSRREAVRKDGE